MTQKQANAINALTTLVELALEARYDYGTTTQASDKIRRANIAIEVLTKELERLTKRSK